MAVLALPFLCACGKRLPGMDEVPPGVVRIPGAFEDVGPRWSHDGSRIAFLRRTTDRKYQLFVARADLSRVTPLLEPEVISPDRPLRTSRLGWRAPDCLAWSPDDRYILFPRAEWMTFPDGEKLPGMGIWKFDLRLRRADPVAIHPHEYKGSLYYYRTPAWSPDGKHIAFIGEGLRGETALYVIPASGPNSVVESARYDSFQDVGWPAWSPDGKRLAFRQGIRRGYTADPVETIRLIEPGGPFAARVWATTPTRYRELLQGETASSGLPTGSIAPRVANIDWTPDGNGLTFSVLGDAADLRTSLRWKISLNESERQFDATDSGSSLPGGTGEDFDWSPDHSRIVTAGPATQPGSTPPLTTLRLLPAPGR